MKTLTLTTNQNVWTDEVHNPTFYELTHCKFRVNEEVSSEQRDELIEEMKERITVLYDDLCSDIELDEDLTDDEKAYIYADYKTRKDQAFVELDRA